MLLLVPLATLLGLVSTSVSHAAPRAVSQPVSFTSHQAASTPTYSYFPLLSTRKVFGSSGWVVVVEANFSMAGGEIRRVTDQLDVRVKTGNAPEVDNRVICLDQNYNIIGAPGTQPVPYSNAAYEERGTETGHNYTENGHAYQWNVSTLIQAPAQSETYSQPEENYHCLLLAQIDSGYQMTVLAPTSGETTYGTWLEVSAQNEVGAQEVQSTPLCNPAGTAPSCVYLGGSARLRNPAGLRNPTAEDVPWQLPNGTNNVWTWTAADDATSIDGVATFQITSCTHRTGSCSRGELGHDIHSAHCIFSKCENAFGYSVLDIDQLYPGMSVCVQNWAYSEKSSGGRVFQSYSFDISNEQHHLPLYYHISAPIQPCGGSRMFHVILYIRWTDGNAVKVDGGNVNLLNVYSSVIQ